MAEIDDAEPNIPGLEPGVGLHIVQNPGQLVRPVHTVRNMKIYGVTETELRTITVVNALTAAFFSLGTGCFSYVISITVSASFTSKIPEETLFAMKLFDPLLIFLGIAFYICGAVSWIIRGGFVKTIKEESDPRVRNEVNATRGNRFSRAWAEFRR